VTALQAAKEHLAKAREFLEVAELSHDLDSYNAAASNAVTSGINSKDAICLTVTGRSEKNDNHNQAIAELKTSGRVGNGLATTFSRLLKLKPKAQYQSESISATDAAKAVDWAAKMLEGARSVFRE
jgi:uncharacterized protein (UPF0332 family)